MQKLGLVGAAGGPFSLGAQRVGPTRDGEPMRGSVLHLRRQGGKELLVCGLALSLGGRRGATSLWLPS